MINIACISKAGFFEIQRTLLFPVVNRFYKMLRDEIYEGCSNAVTNHFSGDGRCDSPGYSAKYITYSLINTERNMIVGFQVIHVSQVGNSNRMEKYRLEIYFKKLINLNMSIASLKTDRHTQIRAFIKKEYSFISHQFNVWHFSKSIKKKLCKHAKSSSKKSLNDWIKPIISHFW